MNKTFMDTAVIIFGIHPLIEVLTAKRRKVYVVYTTKQTPQSWNLIERLLAPHNKIEYVSRERLTQLAGTTDHQGVVAHVALLPIRKKMFDPEKAPFLVMLDGIQDPRNLGAILRSAYCTGAYGVIITKKNSAPLNGVAIKSSAGLAEHVEIYESASAVTAVTELKAAGYQLYLAALGGVDARTVDYAGPLCLVIGSEGTGISSTILKSGTKIMLAQKKADISYNASVASGILLFMISSRLKIV